MAMSLRALIVEDSEDDAELLVHYLRENGFKPHYTRVDTGEAMRACLQREAWDVVFSDFTMPAFDAFEALNVLKLTHVDIPFIVVSGTIGEDRAVAAMQAGARDYILKGNLKRLAPAVRRELREAQNRRRTRGPQVRVSHRCGDDPLLQSSNRVQFLESINRTLAITGAANRKAAVLLLEVDRFKELDDTLGHVGGDALLLEIGSRIRETLAAKDYVVRLDKGRFGILLGGVTAYHDTRIVVGRITKALEPPVVMGNLPIGVEPRIGIALYPAHAQDANGLLQRAATAMSRAKRAGLVQSVYEPARDMNGSNRRAMLEELMAALGRGDLLLQYQPKIDLYTRTPRSLEALLRWNHALRGLMLPGAFIPAAERTGLVRNVLPWVLESALSQCRAWQAARPGLGVSINLSARSLHDPDLHELIAAELSRNRVTPDLLAVEVPESALVNAPPGVVSSLEQLAAMGVCVSLDDFGRGYSSIQQLKSLPIHELKIDGSLIANVAISRSDRVIVRMLADIAHNLRMKVVAEGVVDAAINRHLVKLGCDMAQGHFFGGPFPGDKLDDWFREQEA